LPLYSGKLFDNGLKNKHVIPMPSQIVIDCSKAIKKHGFTLAVAESVTAGRLASEFSLTNDSGEILKGGLVCYDARLKEDILGIERAMIEKFTPESAEITEELAFRLRDFIKSDIQVAVTGLTTPGGSENADKPVGTIFIHVLIQDNSIAVREVFSGNPQQIVLQAVDLAARTIHDQLNAIEI
jgi:nicotinamide-nucleotide amidase